MFPPCIHERQMLRSAINEAITEPFLSLWVFGDEKLNFWDKEMWLMNCSGKQPTRKLHHFIHNPSKHFSSNMIYNFDLKMNNLIFQTSFWAYKMLLPCRHLLDKNCSSSSVQAQESSCPVLYRPRYEINFARVPFWMNNLSGDALLCRQRWSDSGKKMSSHFNVIRYLAFSCSSVDTKILFVCCLFILFQFDY